MTNDDDGDKPIRNKSKLTALRLSWLEWFQLLDGPTNIDLRLSTRLALRYAGMSDSLQHFLKTGAIIVWPAVGTLARQLRVSERSVQGSLRRMEEKFGALKIKRSKGGSGRTNTYHLLPHNPATMLAGLDDAPNHKQAIAELENGPTPQNADRKPRKSGAVNPAKLIAEESPPKGGNNSGARKKRAPEKNGASSAPLAGAASLAPEKKNRGEPKIEDGLALIAFLLKNDAVSKLCLKAENYFEPDALETISARSMSLLGTKHGKRFAVILLLSRRTGQASTFLKRLKEEAVKGERLAFVGDDLLEEFQRRNDDRMPTTDDFLAFLREAFEQVKQRWLKREKDEEGHCEQE